MSPIIIRKNLLLLLLLTMLAGCAVKFIYNQLDWIIPWYLDDYVALDSRQELMLDTRLARYLGWHRSEQLPEYAEFIEWVADAVGDGFTQQELDRVFSRSEQLTEQLFQPVSASFVDIFAELTDSQILQIRENLQHKNREYVEKYIETSERRQREQRAQDLQRFIERWAEELSDEQVGMIERWSGQFSLMGREFLQTREAWQQRLFQILQRRNERDYLQGALNELFTSRRFQRGEAHERKFRENEKLLKALYLQLDGSMDSYQRGQMQRRLRAYARDFRELSRQ